MWIFLSGLLQMLSNAGEEERKLQKSSPQFQRDDDVQIEMLMTQII